MELWFKQLIWFVAVRAPWRCCLGFHKTRQFERWSNSNDGFILVTFCDECYTALAQVPIEASPWAAPYEVKER